jgi:hypothetical protein
VIFCWCEMKFVSELGSFSVKIENWKFFLKKLQLNGIDHNWLFEMKWKL